MTRANRPNLELAMARLKPGDVLAVASLDRVGRSLSHVIAVVNGLQARGIGFVSVAEAMDSRDAGGAGLAHVFEALAQFERNVVKERARDGLSAAGANGRAIGRRPVITPEKLKLAKSFIADGLTVREAAARIKVSKTVLYDALRANARLPAARGELVGTE